MVDMRRGCTDDLKERVYEAKAVIDEVKNRGYLDPVSVNLGRISNVAYLQPFCSCLQRINRFPCCAEDTKHFQPEQELLLQHAMDSRSDRGCTDRMFVDEMFVPRLACILQNGVDTSLGPIPQFFDLRVQDGIRKPTHILLQRLIHHLEATNQKFRMVDGERDPKPLVNAPGWIDNEVGEGLVEGSNGGIHILLKDEE